MKIDARMVVIAGALLSATCKLSGTIGLAPTPADTTIRIRIGADQGFIGRFDEPGVAAGLGLNVGHGFSPAFSADIPSAPTSLVATASGTTVTLTWSPSTGAPTTYVIEAGSAPGLANLANFSTGSTATSFTATNVPSGSYYVRVRARNADGTSGPSNEVLVVVTGCAPNPPTNLTVVVSGNMVTISWLEPLAGGPPTSYVLEVGSSPGASNVFNANVGNVTTVSGAGPNGTYFARVRSVNACGTSAPSTEAPFVIGGAPGPNLSGTWSGTATTTVNGTTRPPVNITLLIQHIGTSLIGTQSPSTGVTLNVTLTGIAGAVQTYTGRLTFTGGRCSPAIQTGAVTVDTLNLTMAGTFSGMNRDCQPESNTLNLRREAGDGFRVWGS